MGNAPLGSQSSALPLPGGAVESGSLTVAELAASLQQFLVPTGSVLPFAGESAPSGFLVCNGTAVSRTTYADLYTVLGGALSPYGQGDGSSTFNLPNLLGRVPVGEGTGAQNGGSGTGAITSGTALSARTRGQWSGDERLQSHTHTVSSSGSGTTNTNNGDLNHNHGYTASYDRNGSHGFAAGPNTATYNWATFGAGTDYRNLNHTHGFSVTVSGTSADHSRSGKGASENMIPFLVVNYIIKF